MMANIINEYDVISDTYTTRNANEQEMKQIKIDHENKIQALIDEQANAAAKAALLAKLGITADEAALLLS